MSKYWTLITCVQMWPDEGRREISKICTVPAGDSSKVHLFEGERTSTVETLKFPVFLGLTPCTVAKLNDVNH